MLRDIMKHREGFVSDHLSVLFDPVLITRLSYSGLTLPELGAVYRLAP